MPKIQVGMMVEIVDSPQFIHGRQFIGEIRRVSSQCAKYSDIWLLEGEPRDYDGVLLGFHAQDLKPIYDGNTKTTWDKVPGWQPREIA